MSNNKVTCLLLIGPDSVERSDLFSRESSFFFFFFWQQPREKELDAPPSHELNEKEPALTAVSVGG